MPPKKFKRTESEADCCSQPHGPFLWCLNIAIVVGATVLSFLSTINKCQFASLENNATVGTCFGEEDQMWTTADYVKTFGPHFFLDEYIDNQGDVVIKGCKRYEYEYVHVRRSHNPDIFQAELYKDWAAKVAYGCQIVTCIFAGSASVMILCVSACIGQGQLWTLRTLIVLAFLSQLLVFVFFANSICKKCGCVMDTDAILSIVATCLYPVAFLASFMISTKAYRWVTVGGTRRVQNTRHTSNGETRDSYHYDVENDAPAPQTNTAQNFEQRQQDREMLDEMWSIQNRYAQYTANVWGAIAYGRDPSHVPY